MTTNPARLQQVGSTSASGTPDSPAAPVCRGLGTLRIGALADVTLIDPTVEWTINASQFASTGRNCPFDGRRVKSRAEAVIVGGDLKLLRDQSQIRG